MKTKILALIMMLSACWTATSAFRTLVVNLSDNMKQEFSLDKLVRIDFEDDGLQFYSEDEAFISYADIISLTFSNEEAGSSVLAVISDAGSLKFQSDGNTLSFIEYSGGEALEIWSVYGLRFIFRPVYNGETIDISNLPAGIYVVKLGRENVKFIK